MLIYILIERKTTEENYFNIKYHKLVVDVIPYSGVEILSHVDNSG